MREEIFGLSVSLRFRLRLLSSWSPVDTSPLEADFLVFMVFMTFLARDRSSPCISSYLRLAFSGYYLEAICLVFERSSWPLAKASF